MNRSVNPLAFVGVGLLLAALPFLGFPTSWETFFELIAGAALVTLGLTLWWKNRIHAHNLDHSGDTFVESRGEHQLPDIAHHAEIEKPVHAPIIDIQKPMAQHAAMPSPYVSAPKAPTVMMPEIAKVVMPSNPITSVHSKSSTPVSVVAKKPSRPKIVKTPAKVSSTPKAIPSPVAVAPRPRKARISRQGRAMADVTAGTRN